MSNVQLAKRLRDMARTVEGLPDDVDLSEIEDSVSTLESEVEDAAVYDDGEEEEDEEEEEEDADEEEDEEDGRS